MRTHPVQTDSVTTGDPGAPAMASRPAAGPLVEAGAAFANLTGLATHHPAPASGDLEPARASHAPERFDVIVIGAGQAGLSVGHHLARHGNSFVILEANARVGDSWRRRWDSLRLFTPAEFDGLDGMRFPAPAGTLPTKDEMADYLEAYARRFGLPVRTGIRVDGLSRQGDRYLVTAGDQRFEAEHVVVAMANYQVPRVPEFAARLDPRIVQLHSLDYRNPSQLRPGGVLVVGAGNSGAEIAIELARHGHPTWMSGRDTGHIPFRIQSLLAKLVLTRLVLRVLFHRVLTLDTPIGRKARPEILSKGGPLIRVKPKELASAGVRRVARVAGARDGRPLLAGGEALDVANVIWCTGYRPDFSWIRLPGLEDAQEPEHERGVVPGEPGFYFVGLHFLYAFSSTMIHGVGRDARHVAGRIASRVRAARAA